ncbi:hypothetical protein VMCG_03607 [Cytospora schulzeri]|uniref:PhoD-like phosphatase domain-containing protein n=1 Tax=Cytospora schulzeri TaxID=448051 RepID=A0A423WWL5_9PEZI|nr:hypothetical protein VMCG_03607 [Valsa malicola]
MPTPYWGDLPGPTKVSGRSSTRGSSDDYTSRPPQLPMLDTETAFAPQPTSNRASVQTYNTESQTGSSLSPYASPTTSSFQGRGLGHRPPSLPYGQGQYPPEILEKRRRRASKNREEDYAYSTAGAALPPAAPDVPKAPSVSFRHPYGNGGLPYTYQKEAPQQPDFPLSPGVMDPDYYPPLGGADQPKRSDTIASQSSSRQITSESAAAPTKNVSLGGSVNGNRKASLPIEEDGRLFADARSPLQKLELTLDSITKEEKRARLAAAEQRARERSSRGSNDQAQQHAVRFNDKAIVTEPESSPLQVLPDPLPAQPSITPQRASVGQDIAQQRTTQPGMSSAPKTSAATFAQDTGITQRNLSFRERAARNEIKLLNGSGPDDSPAAPPATTPTSGYPVSRSESNKLTKEPPGDPRYQQRFEAEKKHAQISTRQQRGASHHPSDTAPGMAAASESAGPTPPSKTAGGRSPRIGPAIEREFWRGTVMVVTQDQDSSYDIAPTLRLFAQPLELLPPPPPEVHGEIPPEFVDPIAGHPKLGRKGETLYVRPVDHLDESKDLSRDETDEGLFEKTRSPPHVAPPDGSTDAPGSFAARRKRISVDGEKVGKYKDVRGYRLHAERGYTFWRFSIEVELRDKEQRIAYRINRGPATGFWVPAKGQSMNIMFHSCNGFSLSVDPDQLSGPDPMWRDVLNSHQSRPFHVMLGGGDQLYCDAVMRQTDMFQEWLMIRNPVHKHNAPFTLEMQDELEEFYLERYSMWFSQGLFGLANSQIPMVNMYDDHDIIDGFGSYPHHFMSSPVFSGLGNVAFKYYMLFQHQSIVDETEEAEPSWALSAKPGPYIQERSRSLFMNLGSKVALLAVDCRTERMRDQVVRDETWDMLMDRCYSEIVKGKTEHLLVLLGVPIAYPRLVWLENILTSRLLDPVKALGKTGLFGNVFNKFDGGVEVLDDLDDHWTAKSHKDERRIVLEDLQDLAADRSVRITILSGDVHLAAVGQFYSNPKLELAKHKDFRYMPNIISSAIVNTPPPDLMADVLNKRNKVHHLDKDTDEDMIPMFAHGVEGKPRNNKRLLPHRNWCSIREYTPGQTPPSSPPESVHEAQLGLDYPGRQDNGFANKGTTRRLSKRNRGPAYRADIIDSRPPVSGSRSGGIFRTLSSRGRSSTSDVPTGEKPPGKMKRTMSLTRVDLGSVFRRKSKSRNRSQVDDGGINGTWGDSDLEDVGHGRGQDEGYDLGYEGDTYDQRNNGQGFPGNVGLRGGGGLGGGGSYNEFSEGDDSYFTTRAPQITSVHNGSSSKAMRILGEEALHGGYGNQFPQQPQYQQERFGVATNISGPGERSQDTFRPKPFHRTPTDMSIKKAHKRTKTFDVNIEGGLDICLNVEVSPKDPAGITVPYRLLVPKLWYDAKDGEEVEMPMARGRGEDRGPGPIKRLFSLSRARSTKATRGSSVTRGQRHQEGPEIVVSGADGPGSNGAPAPGTAI